MCRDKARAAMDAYDSIQVSLREAGRGIQTRSVYQNEKLILIIV